MKNLLAISAALALWILCGPAAAQTLPSTQPASAALQTMDAEHQAAADKLIARGVEYLMSHRQADGGWSLGPGGKYTPAATALVLTTLMELPDFRPGGPKADVVDKGFEVLMSFRQKDGGFYNPAEGQQAYTTALAVTALSAAGKSRFKPQIDAGVAYLNSLQIAPGQESPDGKVVAEADPRIGGVGYGKAPRYEPNLSVLGFVMDSWQAADVPADDPHVRKAAEFLGRLQNRSESNPMDWAKAGSNDGGFVYGLTESKAGASAGGGLRSYGTMTYVGFKQMLYAGLTKNDPRVRAAFDWIRANWNLDANANMPDDPKTPGREDLQGLYYGYVMFAKALRAWGEPVIEDKAGVKHNWRHELIDALGKRLRDDGSWLNDADRWEEGSPVLVTAYAVRALQEATK